jgi:hypothetical protein
MARGKRQHKKPKSNIEIAQAAAMLPIGEVAGANLGTAGCARRSPTPGAQEGDGRR